jgi:hypothetical protein
MQQAAEAKASSSLGPVTAAAVAKARGVGWQRPLRLNRLEEWSVFMKMSTLPPSVTNRLRHGLRTVIFFLLCFTTRLRYGRARPECVDSLSDGAAVEAKEPLGWTPNVGAGKKDEQNLVGYYRFSEGARAAVDQGDLLK